MKPFLDENFLLKTKTARRLYADYARTMPVLDYHCHLSPELIATDHQFSNLTRAWLEGDHYKWRAMRTNGIHESYCTGDQPDREKFRQWAATVPYTVRNPLFHWTHLELVRYFGINEILEPASADNIYDQCNELLAGENFSARNLLKNMNVKMIGTTDDPVDSLDFHRQLKEEQFEISVLPSFRPDRAMNVNEPNPFNDYLAQLEAAANISIKTVDDFLDALKSRHDFFESMGCRISDHGLEEIYAEDFTDTLIRQLFDKIRSGKALEVVEQRQFKSAMLLQFAEWDFEKGWVQQFHLGAMRNNNSRMINSLGPDSGWDSIGDFPQGRGLAKFLDRLDKENRLTKTILYNLNPADNALMATMTGNFNDGSVPGKLQWGSAWWFMDQKDGMINQLNTLSNMGLISRFVGMITDSRSFLSYPRHEYFRRILCDLFGEEMENGELPSDLPWIGKLVSDICYNNAQAYFGIGPVIDHE